MIGVLVVNDFRNSETWKEARFLVCTLLEFTDLWSQRLKYRSLARDVERLSLALLSNMTQGYERKGDASSILKARKSIDDLETTLQKVMNEGALKKTDSERLQSRLETIKKTLKTSEI